MLLFFITEEYRIIIYKRHDNMQNYEKAIMSYEKAQKIYPSMKSPKIMIKKIKELIKKQSI